VEECARRDVKGLYEKGVRGDIPQFTGVSDPYEPPEHAEIELKTAEESVEESAAHVIDYLRKRGLIEHV